MVSSDPRMFLDRGYHGTISLWRETYYWQRNAYYFVAAIVTSRAADSPCVSPYLIENGRNKLYPVRHRVTHHPTSIVITDRWDVLVSVVKRLKLRQCVLFELYSIVCPHSFTFGDLVRWSRVSALNLICTLYSERVATR